jgi:WD40 repeat protein/serine/threonine protein kinase
MSVHEQSVFAEALEIQDLEARAKFLDRVCAGNPELRKNVDSLLAAYSAGEFLESPALVGVSTTETFTFTERPGTVIGPYKLLEQIGEGGFGVVFMAEQQQPVRRKVALKIVKPGMDTRQVVARFEAERQALALMDHTHIARVLDAGATDSGRPYFVMELVRGIPITGFCDDNQLSLPERLELFVTVCQAVQHAHQKGIIHCDLKPSNVLVSLQDGTPLVKVIDFGIAKALGQERLTDKTLVTGFAHMIGTPLYMSPEQAQMSGQDVDTRTDIYSLGVLLYELLTGTTPFDKERLKEASYDEIRRIIREEEPAKPSTRISTLGQAATTVSANRKSEPKRLSQLFRGELDWIVMRALEKDLNRRYDTASSFAADVQRYLHDEPVQACPPSTVYRFRKFARRNKAVLLTASVVGCTLLLAVVGLAASTYVVMREKAQTEAAKEELERTVYYQRIALAEREWYANNLSGMERLLDACPTDLRGWEWRYLRRLRYKALPLMQHNAAVFSVAVSPDGNRLASSSQDGFIKIWEAKTGQELRSIPAHENHVRSIALSPDGQSLASGSWDKTVKVWDAQTGRGRYTLTGHQGEVWSVAFSPDGKLLASAGGNGQVNGELASAGGNGQVGGELKLWDTITGSEVRSFRGHTDTVSCVAFSPDGQRLASGAAGTDKTVKLWDVRTGQELSTFRDHEQGVMGVAFSPDGHLLASCGSERSGLGELKVWDATTGQVIRDLHRTRGVWCVAFSPDGRRLASGSFDQTVKIWDVASGHEALTLRGPFESVRSVVFSPDGHRLFSCGHDGIVRVWDATPLGPQEDEDCLTLRAHGDEVTGVAFHPTDPAVVGSASLDGTVKLWNTRTALPLLNIRPYNLRGKPGAVSGLAFSPDGGLLATVGDDDHVSIKVWDTESGNRIDHLSGPLTYDLSVAFLPDGSHVASAGSEKLVRIWNLRTGAIKSELKGHTWMINGVATSANGKQVVSVGGEGTVRLWDVESGNVAVGPRSEKRTHGWCVAISHDGRQLASFCVDRSVKVWDASTWKVLHSFPDPTGVPVSVAFSPDGRWIAWGGSDSTVKLCPLASEEIQVLHGHTDWVQGVAFSSDSKQVASGSADGTVKIWNVPPLRESTEAAEK